MTRRRRDPRSAFRPVALAASVLTVVVVGTACGCASKRPVLNLPRLCKDASNFEEAEECGGWLVDQLVVGFLGIYPDERLERYVRGVGRRLAKRSGSPALPWTFRVLDDPGVQAWAAPGSHVYVTRGLLAHLGSEAELAAVLGHEIGHVAAGHTDRLLDSLPDPTPDTLADLSVSFEHGRDEERQADQLAVEYLVRTGYDPRAIQRALSAVTHAVPEPDGRAAREEGWADRHPPLSVRLALVARRADGRSAGARREKRYLRRIEGIVVGEDPRRGHVEGRRFVHPGAGFSFGLPEDWTFDEWVPGTVRSQWFKAWSSDLLMSLALLRLGDGEVQFAEDKLREAMERRPTRRRNLGGVSAVEGTLAPTEDGWVRVQGGEGGARVALFEGNERSTFALVIFGRAGTGERVRETYEKVARSFRKERGPGPPPARIRLVRVRRPTTLAALAGSGCGTEGDLDLLRRLNDEAPDVRLRPGRLVKCPTREAAP